MQSLFDLHRRGEPMGGLLGGYTPSNEIVDRATMLPIGQYEDGSLTFAWPGFLKDAYEGAVRSFEQGRQLPRVDSEGYYAGTPRAEPLDAFNAASAAPVGTIGARATGLTRDVGDLGMFAGRGAKTADHAKLAEAERLASQGAPREQIWNDTGWFQGVDGKWRFEIDDSASAYNPTRGSTRVGHSLAHPDLADAYPDLPGMKLSFSERPSNGAFYQAQDRIGLGSSPHPDDHRVLLHELQHAVQNKEGMQFGSNWNDIGRDAYRKTAGEVEARATEQRLPMSADERAARPPWLDYDVPETAQLFANDSRGGLPALFANAMERWRRPAAASSSWVDANSGIGLSLSNPNEPGMYRITRQGEPIGYAAVDTSSGKAEIVNIKVDGGPNALGLAGVRGLREAFRQAHPDISEFSGVRVSGSRTGPAAARQHAGQTVRFNANPENAGLPYLMTNGMEEYQLANANPAYDANALVAERWRDKPRIQGEPSSYGFGYIEPPAVFQQERIDPPSMWFKPQPLPPPPLFR